MDVALALAVGGIAGAAIALHYSTTELRRFVEKIQRQDAERASLDAETAKALVERAAREFCRARSRTMEDEAAPCDGKPVCPRCVDHAIAAIGGERADALP